jgi:hypothetical protein
VSDSVIFSDGAMLTQIQQLTAERDDLARKLAVADKKNQHSLVNNICPDHRDKQQGKPCLACEIENAERIIKSIATMLGWLNVPPLRMIEGDISVLKERAQRADAAEAKVRELDGGEPRPDSRIPCKRSQLH